MGGARGREYVLTLSCPDKPGIVYAVASFLVQHSGNILASQQYGESPDGRFFMRVHFTVPPPGQPLADLERDFSWVAEAFHMTWQLHDQAVRVRTLIMVSRKGARPYHQAHARGVKLVGATAHYVTPDLDEGPIIEQDVARVDHNMNVEDCAAVGRDVESAVLARAVKWHVEHRILLNGNRTVVFA